MTDPAVDAAQRAYGVFIGEATERGFAIAAAREALKPIRELHRHGIWEPTGKPYCIHCRHREVEWPCPTARLIYTTEELEQK